MNKREVKSKEIEQMNAELISSFIEGGEVFRDVKNYEENTIR